MRRMRAFILTLGLATASGGGVWAADDAAWRLHLLNRLAYGPSTAEAAELTRLGPEAWIARQLKPESVPEPEALRQRLAGLETLRLSPAELFERHHPQKPTPDAAQDPEAQRRTQARTKIVIEEAAEARLLRALASPRQLQEVMAGFWFNHFNIFARKGLDKVWIGHFQEQAIHPYALGRFRDVLGATAKHPAMLFYLDNWRNVAPNPTAAARKPGAAAGLNENFARELMELHSLGVNGGYSQADVVALARILTGWGVADARREGGAAFNPHKHESGDKTLLGRVIKGGGAEELEQALDLLAAHPSTAKFICAKLVRHFVSDTPSPALVERLAKRWRETDGDLRAVLTLLFASAEFRDAKGFGGKFKTPEEFVLSAARASGATFPSTKPLLEAMARLGQPLYGRLTPDGYADVAAAWMSPDALVQRADIAATWFGGKPGQFDSDALAQLLGPTVTPQTQRAVAAAEPRLRPALLLGGPDFMRR